MANHKLTRQQWEELENQYSRTPAMSDSESEPGEHFKLIALLNHFGFHPMTKQAAMELADRLLSAGWDE